MLTQVPERILSLTKRLGEVEGKCSPQEEPETETPQDNVGDQFGRCKAKKKQRFVDTKE